MRETKRRKDAHGGESGFTLVEALVAIVVLIFGLMAVTNLLLVAASSNSVANQSTAAVNSASRAMDMIKVTTFTTLGAGGPAWDPDMAAKDCDDPTLVVADWACFDDVSGVGRIHAQWWVTGFADLRLFHVRVRAEGRGALSGARSRAEFTTFRSCTNSGAGAGPSPCPDAP